MVRKLSYWSTEFHVTSALYSSAARHSIRLVPHSHVALTLPSCLLLSEAQDQDETALKLVSIDHIAQMIGCPRYRINKPSVSRSRRFLYRGIAMRGMLGNIVFSRPLRYEYWFNSSGMRLRQST